MLSLQDADASDKAFWASQSPSARLEALELMRRMAYCHVPITDRLERVPEVVKRVLSKAAVTSLLDFLVSDRPDGNVITRGSFDEGPDDEFIVADDGQVYCRVVGGAERVWAGPELVPANRCSMAAIPCRGPRAAIRPRLTGGCGRDAGGVGPSRSVPD